MSISKIYFLYNRFILGICLDVSKHFHEVNENEETDNIAKYKLSEVNELVLSFEFLFWGIDIQIPI
jgi:hypothetical protein